MTERSYSRKIRSDGSKLWASGRPLLTWLDIELTERCNNACIHCSINLPAGDEEARAREMTTEDVKGILEEAASLGCLSVRLTGGEPLLREDFEEIYLAARRLGLKVMIFTNATLVSPVLVQLLKRVPPLEKLEVSVYGMSQATYEAVTGKAGSFEAARQGVRLLLAHKIPFVVKGALLPQNKDEAGEFDAWAERLPDMKRKPSYAMLFDLRTRRDGTKNELIRSLRIQPRDFIRFLSRREEEPWGETQEFLARFSGMYGDKLFTCVSAGGKGSVDAYGFFQHCLLLKHPDTVYDLKKGSLRKALMEFLPKLRARTSQDPEYTERCGRCFLKALCQQCPARSWSEHGTLDTPIEYLCEITHAQARAAGILGKEERAWAPRNEESNDVRPVTTMGNAGEKSAGRPDDIRKYSEKGG